MWSWQMAAPTAAGLIAVAWVLKAAPGQRLVGVVPYLREAGVVIGLYALWQIALGLLVVHTGGATSRAATVLGWEHAWHLPSEADLQAVALGHPRLVRWANTYYADVDFPALCCALLWLFARHRDRYRHYRLTLVALTASCTFIQAVPVAPPRLLPASGVIDTGLRFGQSVYGPTSSDPAVLTAMPSVHVAWAALIAVAVISSSASRWRWLSVSHPVLTVLVVVITGNHFWLDGLVAVALLAAVIGAQALAAAVLDWPRFMRDTMPVQLNHSQASRGTSG